MQEMLSAVGFLTERLLHLRHHRHETKTYAQILFPHIYTTNNKNDMYNIKRHLSILCPNSFKSVFIQILFAFFTKSRQPIKMCPVITISVQVLPKADELNLTMRPDCVSHMVCKHLERMESQFAHRTAVRLLDLNQVSHLCQPSPIRLL